MTSIRIVVLTLWLALPFAVTVGHSGAAMAADDKGLFGFFNRSKDNEGAGGPVHMKPFIGGSAYNGGPGPETQPFNLDPRGAKTKTTRFEDSRMHAEAARVRAERDGWIQAEHLKTETYIKQQQEQIWQQQALLSQQRRAEYLRQASMGGTSRAGPLPTGADPALVEMMKKMYLQNLGVMPEMAPASAPQAALPVPAQPAPAATEKAPPAAKEKPERKPRHFFNSQQ